MSLAKILNLSEARAYNALKKVLEKEGVRELARGTKNPVLKLGQKGRTAELVDVVPSQDAFSWAVKSRIPHELELFGFKNPGRLDGYVLAGMEKASAKGLPLDDKKRVLNSIEKLRKRPNVFFSDGSTI